MCKFNSHLFVFLVAVSLCIGAPTARTAAERSLIDLLINGNDHDLRYDQRQKGGENLRIKLDGFFIGIPAEPTGLMLMTDELVNVLGEEVLFGRHGDGNEEDRQNDFKAAQLQIGTSDVNSKQIESHQKGGLELSDQQALSQKIFSEERGGSNRGSRTKVYIVNLLDYIKRNRRT